jgi:transposase-like protein
MEYTAGFKTRMIRRLAEPDAISAAALAEEVGVAQSTLSRWKRQVGTILDMANKTRKDSPKQPHDRPAEEKLRIVMEAAQLSDKELGAFLRKEGVHESHLEAWRRSMLEALTNSSKTSKGSRRGLSEAKRVKALERELRRKEKALAETAALLVLKKKANAIWGDGDDGTGGRNDR